MNPEERKQISAGLSEVIGRFESLAQQPTVSPPLWPQVTTWLEETHALFKEVVDAFVTPCRKYLSEIDSDSREYIQWQYNLEDIWARLNFLRSFHNRAFCYDYTLVIYHHVFIEEMFKCLPDSLPGAKSKFLLLPSGELVVWPSADAFSDLGPLWFTEEHLGVFDIFKKKDAAIFFECHREQDFEHQSVLGHELFHIIVKRNNSINKCYEELTITPALKHSLKVFLGADSDDEEIIKSQLEELFCDYSAAWFYGPVFLKAFAEEIAHYPVTPSITHPASDLRAAFLLATLTELSAHTGFKVLEQYFNLRKRKDVIFPRKKEMQRVSKGFGRTLESLGLTPYKHVDQEVEITRSFAHNIPFVVNDIRCFVNNLPPRGESASMKRYNDLVSESLRKTNLLRQITGYIREPDKLFAVPIPLQSASRQRKPR